MLGQVRELDKGGLGLFVYKTSDKFCIQTEMEN